MKNLDELKAAYPRLFRQIFNLGVMNERNRVLGFQHRIAAAELIANSVSNRNGHPTIFRVNDFAARARFPSTSK
jgi:hypothetical protein